MVLCFRIWGDFLWFDVLGFGAIFQRSVIPRFWLLGSSLTAWVLSRLFWYAVQCVHVYGQQLIHKLYGATHTHIDRHKN